jgi:hypothetical protein
MIFGWCAPRSARVVDENIYFGEFRMRLVSETFDVVLLRIVGGDPLCLDAASSQMLLGLLKIRRFPRGQNNPGALFSERLGNLQPESARPSGDQSGLTSQIKRLLYAAHTSILLGY